MEWLKERLGDDLYGQVKEKLGKDVGKVILNDDGRFIPRDRFDTLTEDRDTFKADFEAAKKNLETVNGELKTLQDAAGLSDDLKKQLSEMQGKLTEAETKAKQDKRDLFVNSKLENSLTKAGADENYLDFLLGKVNREGLAVSDDLTNITGMDDQVKALQESHPKLFGEDKFKGTPPIDGDSPGKDFFAEDEVKNMNQDQVNQNLDNIMKSMTKW